jgi:hypothetical protein
MGSGSSAEDSLLDLNAFDLRGSNFLMSKAPPTMGLILPAARAMVMTKMRNLVADYVQI